MAQVGITNRRVSLVISDGNIIHSDAPLFAPAPFFTT